MVTRRNALRLAGLSALAMLATQLPAMAPPFGRPTSDGARGTAFPSGGPWGERWESLIAAAAREGALSLLTVAGDGYRTLVQRFERTFPNVRVQHFAAPTISSWLASAREGGVKGASAFDVGLIHSGISFADGRAEGLWTPLRPLLFRPDVIDGSAWRGGVDARFMDAAGELCFAWEYQVVHTYAINTDKVAAGTITTARDLLDPRWKGQILSSDPRVGIGLLAATSVAKAWGFETLGRLLVDQRPKLIPTASGTNITESIVRGEYPIALGVRPKALNPLRAQGRGQNVTYLDLPDADFVATNMLFSFARTARPAAAALFANWMLTKDVQTELTEGLHTNSARTDVPTFEPDGVPTAGKSYYEPERETNTPHAAATQRFVGGLPLVL